MNIVKVKSEIVQCNSEFNNMLDRFVQYVDVSQSSIHSYIKGIKSFLRYISERGIKTPTRETVIEYKKCLSESKSASTIALYLSSLRRFFSWCASENMYSDITSGVKSPRIDSGHKKDAFSATQLKQIISRIERKTLKGKRDFAIFCLTAATGLRTCEVIRADISDIRTVYGEACLFIRGKGKSSKSDFVKLSEHVLRAIQTYLEARGKVSENEPLFASLSHRNYGQRMTTYSISRICKMAMRNVGYNSSRYTAHSLRHSAITLALIQGMSIQDVSQFARHSNISVTMIYSHDIERIKSKCESAISNAIFE